MGRTRLDVQILIGIFSGKIYHLLKFIIPINICSSYTRIVQYTKWNTDGTHTVRVQKENIYKYKNQFVNELLGQLLIQDKPQERSARTWHPATSLLLMPNCNRKVPRRPLHSLNQRLNTCKREAPFHNHSSLFSLFL